MSYSITWKDNGTELVGNSNQPPISTSFQVENNLFYLTEQILNGDTNVDLLLTVSVAGVFNNGETILTKDITVVE